MASLDKYSDALTCGALCTPLVAFSVAQARVSNASLGGVQSQRYSRLVGKNYDSVHTHQVQLAGFRRLEKASASCHSLIDLVLTRTYRNRTAPQIPVLLNSGGHTLPQPLSIAVMVHLSFAVACTA